jgi:uncharacterized protein
MIHPFMSTLFHRGPGRLAFCLLLICAFSLATRAQNTESPLPKPEGYVNDYANVIDPATRKQMEEILTRLDQQQKIEFSVVTVPTTGDRDIFDYSLAVMRGWGIGSADKPGLLLLVAVNDRKYFTQVSRHLEGDLPDGLVGQIQRETLVPAFKSGNYSQGLMNAVQTFIITLGEKRGFDPAPILGGAVSRPSPVRRQRSSGGGLSTCAVIVIIVIILLVLLSSRRGGGGGGCLNLLLLGSIFGNSGGSGWGGGSFGGGGFGGGGGGGFGGFSGGGGDAGGGGAGGGW